MANSGMAIAALVIIGVLLVIFGLFLGGGNLPLIGLGIVSLIAGGVLQVWGARRAG